MAPFDGTQLGATGSDGLGMAPRAKEPESALIPGMAAPSPTPEIGPLDAMALLGPLVPPNFPDTSIQAPQPPGQNAQEPPRWQYDFDPANGLARATFPGEIASASGGGVTSVAAGTGITVGGTPSAPSVGLSNQIAAAGPIGSSALIPVVTVNAQGQLTALTTAAVPGATGGQTFLAADVLLTGTVATILSTGAIGAAGQIFDIEVAASIINNAGSGAFSLGINNGAGFLFATIVHTPGTALRCLATFSVRVTLAAATTFTFQALDSTSATSTIATSAGSPFGVTNHATYIKWTRVG